MDNNTELAMNVDEKQIPAIIQNQFAQVSALRKEIVNATNNAYEAKECAIALYADNGTGKKAINTLQNATLTLANAQVDAIKAQKKSFEYQQKLAETTKYLFGLGTSNIATNRAVIKELEAMMSDASNEELGDLAVSEMMNLVGQLKEQEDVFSKIDRLSKIVREHDEKIEELYAIIDKQNAIIDTLRSELAKK